jgi:hypothetical protein
MALKDWKLITKARTPRMYGDFYTNQKNGNRIIIEKVRLANSKGSVWKVKLLNSKIDFQYFKTKSSALRYAKAYMKKH